MAESKTEATMEMEENEKGPEYSNLKLDSRGVPLVPQPSDHKDDPLNWTPLYKYYVLFLLCLLAFSVQFGAGSLPPAFNTMAKKFGVTDTKATYFTTFYLLLTALTPLLLTPFVNIYGRRPAYIFFTLVAAMSNIGSAKATSYAGVLISRMFVGVGSSVGLAIGGSTICDMFFQGERGKFLGIYALALTNGPHFGPIAGGFINQNLGYQWIFWTNALIIAGIWILFVVSFPETLFSRTEFSTLENRTYLERFTFIGKIIDKPLRGTDFLNNFTMIKYWAVVIPCIYYMTANVYGSLLFVLSLPSLSAKIYGFGTAATGLFIGVPLSVGCLIGESFTGWISDYFAVRYAKRHDGYYKPEVRLWLMPLGLCLPIGLIVAGVCIEAEKPWITVAIGMAISSVGVQAATTITYSYISDCYKPQAAEVSTVINLFRFVFAFTIGFYALPFGAAVGQAKEWGTLAAINFATWLMLLVFVFKGEAIRSSQGLPKLHEDL